MKTTIILSLAILLSTTLFAQTREITQSTNSSTSTQTPTTPSSDFQIDYFIVGGSLGLGPIISTNLVNTGFIGESTIDFMVQSKHHRYGFGLSNTLMGTPENLTVLVFSLGKDNINLHKGYFMYEWTAFKHSPINLGVGAKVGTFTVGNYPDTTKSTFFGSVGPLVEIGHPRFFLYVKPEFGYNSYNTGSWKKDVYVCVNVGFRWKFAAEEPATKTAAIKP